ncbi:DUF4432 domain-containing protein [Planctomycetales bacterium 10988]|nr:DUF4432 domain-containing protein [Planctomycetales bacterium 10988]
MTSQEWILIDTSQQIYLNNWLLTKEEFPDLPENISIEKMRLQGGYQDGVDLLKVNSGQMELLICPTRGMGIWQASCNGVQLRWNSPVKGPVHPNWVDLYEPSGIGWISGFDEWLVRCGLESNGAPEFTSEGQLKYPLHGKIANQPAEKLTVSVDLEQKEIVVKGLVREGRLFCNHLTLEVTYTLPFNQPSFQLTDKIENPSASDCDLELLYHINTGEPFLQAGCELVAPLAKIVPRTPEAAEDLENWSKYSAPKAGQPELVYFTQLIADKDGYTPVLLKNPHAQQGIQVSFQRKTLPYFVLWKNLNASDNGYVTGMEPALNFPNPKSFEKQKDRVVSLAPKETYITEMEVTVASNAEALKSLEDTIQTLAKKTEPIIFQKPDPEWAAL